MEFYSRKPIDPSDEVREMLHVIAGQFGQFLARLDAEQALRESEEHITTLAAHAPVFLFALDRKGLLTMSEGGALEALGYMPGESVNQSIFDLYHDSPELLAAARQALTGEIVIATLPVRKRTFEVHFVPQFLEGRVTGVDGVATDITPRGESSASWPTSVPSRSFRSRSRSHGR
jgi:PAS domain S-box-containing protein